ncbi:hypothetical protein M404DRAFT_997661 [Pisolithus tinctorius Marx 270]|uniref:Uncharacterized protein n=1 Tax=Pisolithus tinctorius Marx 270 TaxID=870435 RepID=A0A0C3KEF1_PISTI|nr:hypothetical protein M404DRAFT_997661 [Pisolithus tinctorius Marx 270]
MDVITSELMLRIDQFRELILDTEGRQELRALLSHLVNTAAPSLQRPKITSNDLVHGQGILSLHRNIQTRRSTAFGCTPQCSSHHLTSGCGFNTPLWTVSWTWNTP